MTASSMAFCWAPIFFALSEAFFLCFGHNVKIVQIHVGKLLSEFFVFLDFGHELGKALGKVVLARLVGLDKAQERADLIGRLGGLFFLQLQHLL